MTSKLLQRLWHEPPVFLPIAALYHLFLLILGLVELGGSLAHDWPTLLWYAAALALSVYCLLLKRWAAIAYVLLTATGLLLQFVLPVDVFWKNVGATLMPFDVLMCFFLLFFFKRFH